MPVGYSIYRNRESYVHQGLDPRTKLLCLLVLFGIALCYNNPLILGAELLAVVLVAVSAKLGWSDLRGFVLLSLWLILLSVVIWPAYVHQGTQVGSVGSIEITSDGLLFGLAMGFRITIMLLAASVWMLTTSPQQITAGLLAMGLHYKAGLALSSTIRFIPLMNAERATILEAQRARGLDLERGNPVRRMFRAAPVLVPLFSRAVMTAQNLTVAMDARGFGARPRRTNIVRLSPTRLDYIVCAVAVVILALSIVMRILGIGVLVQGTV